MMVEWEQDIGGRRMRIDVRVRPTYGEILRVTDVDSGEPFPPALLDMSARDVDERAAQSWADEQGR